MAGDCGLPAAGEEEAWPLSPVLNRSSIPSIEEFNPGVGLPMRPRACSLLHPAASSLHVSIAAHLPCLLTADPLTRVLLPRSTPFCSEGSCRFVLWTPFLEACSTGASADCCQVLASQTRLSSSAPFATCLCRPSFYQARRLLLLLLALAVWESWRPAGPPQH